MPPLRHILRLERLGPGHLRAHVPATWTQGRATFGGLIGALGLEALQADVPDDRPPRSALVSFVAPVAPGPVDLLTEQLRVGGSLSHAQARLVQDGTVGAVIQVAFGAARPTLIQLTSAPAPAAPPPDECPQLPSVPGVTPDFTRHFDYRWTADTLPFCGGAEPHVQGWIRLREPGPVTAPTVLALLDAWPPPVWSTFDRPAPGSSVTWQTNLVGDLSEAQPEDWWFYEARTTAARAGYTDFEAHLWDARGGLVAQSRQLFAEFSARAPR